MPKIEFDFPEFTLDSFIELLKNLLEKLYDALWLNKEEK